MKLNKKVVESMTVTSAMLVMTTITAFGGSTEDSKSGLTETVVLSKGGRAGIISELCDKEMDRLNESGMITASIGRGQRDIVSKSQADAAETEDAAGSAAGVGEFAAEAAAQSVETDAAEVTADVPAVEEIVEEEAAEPCNGKCGRRYEYPHCAGRVSRAGGQVLPRRRGGGCFRRGRMDTDFFRERNRVCKKRLSGLRNGSQ